MAAEARAETLRTANPPNKLRGGLASGSRLNERQIAIIGYLSSFAR